MLYALPLIKNIKNIDEIDFLIPIKLWNYNTYDLMESKLFTCFSLKTMKYTIAIKEICLLDDYLNYICYKLEEFDKYPETIKYAKKISNKY